MLISAAVALALFAAPETTQSGDTAAQAPAAQAAPAAEAKPVTRKVCYQSELSGSRLPKKVCKTETVKPAEPKQEAEKAPAANPAS
jgi:hypothetical protein